MSLIKKNSPNVWKKIDNLSRDILLKLQILGCLLKFVMVFFLEKIILMIVWVLYYIWHQNKHKVKCMENE